MSPQLINLVVTRDHAVPIEPLGGTAIVKVDNTGGTVFYSENPQVSATQNQGSIAPGGTQSFQQPTIWLISNGTAGCTVQVAPGGGVGSFIQVAPSGDATGNTDVTAINAALASYTTVQLRGFYYINAPIVPRSNTTLSLTDATIFLVNQSNCNMVLNQDYLNASGGNTNINIIGSGIALFDANSSGQTYSTANTAPAQSYKGHTIILSHVTNYIVSNIQLQHITYYGISPQQCTDGYISNIEARLAGPLTSAIIQTMGQITRLVIDGVRGQSEDDSIAFSTGDLYSAYYADQTLVGPLAGNVSDISVRNVDIQHNTTFPRCHLICMFTGSGCTMQRISLDHINQRFPTQNQGQIGIGVSNYFISAPSTSQAGPNDLADIKVTNTNARFVFSGTCANVKISGVQIPNQPIALDIPVFLFTGGQSGLNYKDISISDVVYNGPASVNPLFQFTNLSGPLYANGNNTVASMKLHNIRINGNVPSLIGNIGANISNLEIRNVNAASFTQGIIAPNGSGTISGFVDGVNVNTPINGQKYGSVPYNIAYGPNMPVWTGVEPTPQGIDRSIVNADSSLVLDAGTAVSASYMYQANSPTYNTPALLTHTSKAFTAPSSGATTTAIDTTGATLLVVQQSYATNFTPTMTDSKGNTWTALQLFTTTSATPLHSILYYCLNPIVGTGHTFSMTGTNIFGALAVAAFSGAGPQFGSQYGANSNSTTTLTLPTFNTSTNQLVVVGLVGGGTGAATIAPVALTVTEQIVGSGNNQNVALATAITTTSSTLTPVWSNTFGATTEASGAATFSFITAGGGGAWKRL